MHVLLAAPDPDAATRLAERLGAQGVDWRWRLVHSGDDALQRLREDRPDVVLVDAGLEGAAPLLRQCLDAAPELPRAVLAGAGDEARALSLLAFAHGAVPRDGSAEAIAEPLLAWARMLAAIEDPALRRRLAAIRRLPAMPRLYLAIQRALDDPTVDLAAIADMILGDPVVAARLLQLANAALFGGGRDVGSVPAAVSRLGLRTTRLLVLAAELFETDARDESAAAAIRRASTLAAWLAPRLGARDADPDHLASAAVLAGLGPMLALQGFADGGDPIPECDAAAAWLVGLWQLPSGLQQAVAWQRAPRASGAGFGLVGAVHVATALAFERPVDVAWLERCGMAAHLPAWRELALRVERQAA